jgi:3',5'-cyclic AMP phosphodiesterase CpdA
VVEFSSVEYTTDTKSSRLTGIPIQEKEPNLIVISGDLTSIASSQDFDRAVEFIMWLSNETHLSIERFIIVPGNHDIQRTAEDGRRFDRFIEFLNQISATSSEFRSRFPDLFSSKDRVLKWDWRKSKPEDLYSITVLDDLSLIVIGFNSVVDNKDDWSRGEILMPQLLSVTEALNKLALLCPHYLKVAVFHHNLFPVPSIEDRWEDRVLANHGLVLSELSKLDFRLILHGHTHYPSAYQHRPYFVYGLQQPQPLIVVCTGTLSGIHRSNSRPQFNFNTIDIEWNRKDLVKSFLITPFSLASDTLQWENHKKIKATL